MWFDHLFGNTESFGIKVSLDTDPYPQKDLDQALQRSWGYISIFAQGRSLCRHYVDGAYRDEIRWYILPFLEWLDANGVRILNEEPFPVLPAENEILDSVAWLEASLENPIQLTSGEEDEWYEDRSRWWESHGLRAAFPGAVVPNLFFHRVGDDIELSWDNESVAPTRPGVRFIESRGFVVVPGFECAAVLRDLVREVSNAIRSQSALSPFHGALANGAGPGDAWKLLLQPATRPVTENPELKGWRDAQRSVTPLSGAFIPHTLETSLLRAVPAGTPDLVQPFLRLQTPGTNISGRLAQQRRSVPTVGFEPWRHGYEVARQFLRAVSIADTPGKSLASYLYTNGVSVDTDDLFAGVVCAVCSFEGRQVRILINKSAAMSDSMKLGTALGHLLMDLPGDRSYGVVSSPWAHWPSTARAKAFAAMLLMPDEEIRGMCRSHGPIDTTLIRHIMDRFGTTATVTTWHLHALRMISDEARVQYLTELTEV